MESEPRLLSKKHYRKIAQILGKEKATENLISAFVLFWKSDNYRFSEGKFRDAITKERGETYGN
jgi:hypothetical protein